MSLEKPLNYCRGCSQDFGSVELFDRHRVGKHDYTYIEGLQMKPRRIDGRRCLSVEEMVEKGWTLGMRGRWMDPARAKVVPARAKPLESLEGV